MLAAKRLAGGEPADKRKEQQKSVSPAGMKVGRGEIACIIPELTPSPDSGILQNVWETLEASQEHLNDLGLENSGIPVQHAARIGNRLCTFDCGFCP